MGDDIDDLLSNLEGESDYHIENDDPSNDEQLDGSSLTNLPNQNQFEDPFNEETVKKFESDSLIDRIPDIDTFEEVDNDQNGSDEIKSETDKGTIVTRTEVTKEPKESEIILEPDLPKVKFTVKGSRSWNTREPYTVQVDYKKLQKDYNDLKASFFFFQHRSKEPPQQREIKEAMIKYYRNGSKGISSEYGEFIFKSTYSLIQELGEFFNFHNGQLNLFIYHLGVLNLVHILNNLFSTSQFGDCLKLLPDKKVIKNLPSEFIKEKVLCWFEDNINIFDLSFDGINEFDEIKKIISQKYYSEVDRNKERLNSFINNIMSESDKKIDKDKIFRSKWNDWFGMTNIIVYKRFVERTIFR
ncbi:MAG: hypothetical protein SVR08_10090 [Spirochaetota bacterium]|nr:hypothetical protein [Spirochaetota bacterium]